MRMHVAADLHVHVAAGLQTRLTVIALASSVGFAACSTAPPAAETPAASAAASLIARSHLTMGASVTLSAWTADEATATAAFDAVFAEFDRLDRVLSVWKDGSDVRRLNAAAGGQPVPVSPETIEVLTIARQVSDWTGGKFDVTFGALSGLWKFDQDQDGTIPSRAAVAARLPHVDYTAVEIDAANRRAVLRRRGVQVHLGGIGKGYAVDRGAAILRARGLHDFMIQSGGDLFVSGRRGDRPWRLGIRDPRGPEERTFAALDLTNSTFSTSGDYERFFITGGVRYHHILDPDLGEPARLSRSVTIVADRAVIADGLSTGVFILGPEKGMALVERLADVEAVIVGADNRVRVSSGLIGKLTMLAAPTDAP